MPCKKKWNLARKSGIRPIPVQVNFGQNDFFAQKWLDFGIEAQLIAPFLFRRSSNIKEHIFIIFLWNFPAECYFSGRNFRYPQIKNFQKIEKFDFPKNCLKYTYMLKFHKKWFFKHPKTVFCNFLMILMILNHIYFFEYFGQNRIFGKFWCLTFWCIMWHHDVKKIQKLSKCEL